MVSGFLTVFAVDVSISDVSRPRYHQETRLNRPPEMKRESWIETLLGKMSLEQKIGQCVVVGMSGTVVTNDLREAIVRYHCSGIRLSAFTRMFSYFSDEKAKQQGLGDDFVPSMQKFAGGGLPPYATPQQYAAMLNEFRQLAADRSPAIPLHMVIDQEGDTSKDFSRGGVVQFPSSMGLAAGNSPKLAYRAACCVARQMKASGLDMIHSPVVDVNVNPNNPEIGHRAVQRRPGSRGGIRRRHAPGLQGARRHRGGEALSRPRRFRHQRAPRLPDAQRRQRPLQQGGALSLQTADRGRHRRHHRRALHLSARRPRPHLHRLAEGGHRDPPRPARIRGPDHHRQHHDGRLDRPLRDRRGLRGPSTPGPTSSS